MFKCEKCGKEYSYGRKIYHECNDNSMTHGVIFEDSKKFQEKIIESYLSNSKADSLYIYE